MMTPAIFRALAGCKRAGGDSNTLVLLAFHPKVGLSHSLDWLLLWFHTEAIVMTKHFRGVAYTFRWVLTIEKHYGTPVLI